MVQPVCSSPRTGVKIPGNECDMTAPVSETSQLPVPSTLSLNNMASDQSLTAAHKMQARRGSRKRSFRATTATRSQPVRQSTRSSRAQGMIYHPNICVVLLGVSVSFDFMLGCATYYAHLCRCSHVQGSGNEASGMLETVRNVIERRGIQVANTTKLGLWKQVLCLSSTDLKQVLS